MQYDLVIIGGGPAGLTAAIYATRYELKTLVLAKEVGGELATAPHVDNYPGLPAMSGLEVMKRIEDHAKSLGAELKDEEVTTVAKAKTGFTVQTKKARYETKTVLFATGNERRKLQAQGEKELLGKGVSYCASCDGPLFNDAIVGVVGGSDSAAKEAIMLTQYAKKVYIIYRKAEIRAEPATKKLVSANKKIEIITNANVTKINGSKMVESVELDTGKTLPLEGLFIEIGGVPASDLAEKLGAKLNEKLEIIVDESGATNVPGVFAAGDVTQAWKQAIVAAGHGATAAYSAYKVISEAKA